MFSAILILLALPFTDLSRSRGLQFRPLSKIAFFIFAGNFLVLMQLGAKHVESPFIEFGQISTVIYFAYFLIFMPLISLFENSIQEFTGIGDNDVKISDTNILMANMIPSSPSPGRINGNIPVYCFCARRNVPASACSQPSCGNSNVLRFRRADGSYSYRYLGPRGSENTRAPNMRIISKENATL
jgi:ubiquinol-cytochrome c reductase cytochrome b subunit